MSTVLGDGVTVSPAIVNYGENSTLLLAAPLRRANPALSPISPPEARRGCTNSWRGYPGDNSFSSSTSDTYSFTVTKANSVIADFFPYGTPVTNFR